MHASPGSIDLGVRRIGPAHVLVVVVALVVTLTTGIVIGRGTVPTRSVSIEREPQSLTLTGLNSHDAEVRRQVMRKMNALAANTQRTG
jgi:hypothetical protein